MNVYQTGPQDEHINGTNIRQLEDRHDNSSVNNGLTYQRARIPIYPVGLPVPDSDTTDPIRHREPYPVDQLADGPSPRARGGPGAV